MRVVHSLRYVDEVIELDALVGNWTQGCTLAADGVYSNSWFNLSAYNETTTSAGRASYLLQYYSDNECATVIPGTSTSILTATFVVQGPAPLRGPGAVNIDFFSGDFGDPIDIDVVTLQYPFLFFGATWANASEPFNTNYNRRPLNWGAPYVPLESVADIGMVTTPESITGLWGGDCVYNMP